MLVHWRDKHHGSKYTGRPDACFHLDLVISCLKRCCLSTLKLWKLLQTAAQDTHNILFLKCNPIFPKNVFPKTLFPKTVFPAIIVPKIKMSKNQFSQINCTYMYLILFTLWVVGLFSPVQNKHHYKASNKQHLCGAILTVEAFRHTCLTAQVSRQLRWDRVRGQRGHLWATWATKGHRGPMLGRKLPKRDHKGLSTGSHPRGGGRRKHRVKLPGLWDGLNHILGQAGSTWGRWVVGPVCLRRGGEEVGGGTKTLVSLPALRLHSCLLESLL